MRPLKGRYRVAIVGAGPHGLTVAVHLAACGVDPADVVVVDPSGEWLSRWRQNFARLGIAHLRSPSVHHPHPDPYALLGFAAAHGRERELHHQYRLPGTELFDDFCVHIILTAGLSDVVVRGEVVEVGADGRLTMSDGTSLRADHVVWATNPAASNALVPIGAGLTSWEEVDLASTPTTVAVIGGGLSAAHLVERALDRDAHVEWITRRSIVTREFDTDPAWLGPKAMGGFDAVDDPAERFAQVIAARGGGSVPSWMIQRLRTAERTGRLCRRVGAIEVRLDGGRPSVEVDGCRVHADAIWTATGDRPCVSGAPPLERLIRVCGVELVAGLPVLDHGLRINGSVVLVAGRLAQLRLGPTAGNLAGARRAAARVVGAVVGLDAMYALAGV